MKHSKKITVQVVNGFVDNGKGGNPAGLVLNADDLAGHEKQVVAAKTGLSETAFVSASPIADFKFDFYTPTKQIAHCGHATVATFSYLKQKGLLPKTNYSKETIDGTRKIILEGDTAFMEQTAPAFTSVKENTDRILLSLGLSEEHLIENAEPYIVNTGNSFLIIGVRNKELLKNLHHDPSLIYAISEAYNLIGYYVFAPDPVITGRDATTRMFGPYYGIPEESATGMAAGPLAAYLDTMLKLSKQEFLIEQGHFMEIPSPGLIRVKLNKKNDAITGLMAGGRGMHMKTLEIEI